MGNGPYSSDPLQRAFYLQSKIPKCILDKHNCRLQNVKSLPWTSLSTTQSQQNVRLASNYKTRSKIIMRGYLFPPPPLWFWGGSPPLPPPQRTLDARLPGFQKNLERQKPAGLFVSKDKAPKIIRSIVKVIECVQKNMRQSA